MGDRSDTPLMNAATSAWLGPYGAGALTADAGATRPRGGLVIDLIALFTADRTRSAAGISSTWLKEARGITDSSGLQSSEVSSGVSSVRAPSTRPPCTNVLTADQPSSPASWFGIWASAPIA